MSNDPWFRAGQQTSRKIEDEKLPPPQSGSVFDAPDTFAKTALVKIGSKVVTAHYFGSAPNVGDTVIVQQSGSDHLMIAQVPSTAGGGVGGGAPGLALQGAGCPPIPAFTLWSHSYGMGPPIGYGGTPDARNFYPHGRINQTTPYRLDHLLGSLVGIDEEHHRNFGVGGAFLLQDEQPLWPLFPTLGTSPGATTHGWAWILQQTSRGMGALNLRRNWKPATSPSYPMNAGTNRPGLFAPFMPPAMAHVLLYGCNDVAWFGDPSRTVDFTPGMMGLAWTEVNRSIIARLRCGGIIEDEDMYDSAFQPYGMSYTGAWLRVLSNSYNSGNSTTAINGSAGTLAVHLGADWPGGWLSWRFRGEPGAGGVVSLGGGIPAFNTGGRMPVNFTSITRGADRNPLPNVAAYNPTYVTVPPWTPSYSTIVRRQFVKRTGAPQTISAFVDATAGPIVFDSVDLEQTGFAAPVVVCNIPIPARWLNFFTTEPKWASWPDTDGYHAPVTPPAGTTYDTTGAARGTQIVEAGDAWAAADNARLVSVINEFTETVSVGTTGPGASANATQLADLDKVCNGIKFPELYFPEDPLHLNAAGMGAAAGEVARALNVACSRMATAAALGAA